MHAIFFSLKRSFHGTLRIARRPLAAHGLTAARFDMLAAIEHNGATATQSAIRRALGVTRPTVSRMLQSLEALGLVERSPCKVDKRQRIVSLTARGLRVIKRAITEMIGAGRITLALQSALTRSWYRDERAFPAMAILDSSLLAIRAAYGDTARLHYPWHPDD